MFFTLVRMYDADGFDDSYGDGTDADDLQATEGETVWLTEKISDDWWRAMSQDGARQGIIPTAYVRQL